MTSSLLNDLAAFADLGTEPPQGTNAHDKFVVRLTREGELIELVVADNGTVIERCASDERKHATFKALLASERFANLSRWADSQRTILRSKCPDDTLPMQGFLSSLDTNVGFDAFDNHLSTYSPQADEAGPRTSIILLDGPAGIGKTSLIRALAYKRACNFRLQQRPLLLHVESRGRVLQNITDLMAFSLQTLRASVTYDQVPVLVKHGLVVLAIDGFDELGDPNGYELAWAQVNDLIVGIRGEGRLLLSGRDTFLGMERISRALVTIEPPLDSLQSYTLLPPSPQIARAWLLDHGWPSDLLYSDLSDSLFEEDSYALRPFFLAELAQDGVATQVANGEIEDLLSFLVAAMTAREADKFGAEVNRVTTEKDRQDFILAIMQEIARDLADNQSSAISADTMLWIAEMVSSELMPASVVGILKNRVGVIAFLQEDDRRNYKRFVHEKVYDYFLSRSIIAAIAIGEVPKCVRRNIFSADFLQTFSEVFRFLNQSEVDEFFLSAGASMRDLGFNDRGRGNLASLMLSAASVAVANEQPVISDFSADEVYLSETLSPVTIRDAVISQLSARSTDLRSAQFEGECVIVTMLGDVGTIPSYSMPLPEIIDLPQQTIYDRDSRVQWMRARWRSAEPKRTESLGQALERLEISGLFDLLTRVVRYRPFWIRDGEERAARKILDDPYWEELKECLQKHDLLVERLDFPAAGRPAPFFHVRNREALKDFDNPPEEVVPFLAELITRSIKLRFDQAND